MSALAGPNWDGRSVTVLSPHLDDAVFSVGAAMSAMTRAGSTVQLITVLAGDPTSLMPAGPWDLCAGFRTAGEAARVRRGEDRRACDILGVTPTWLPYADEQYPRGASDTEIRASLQPHLDRAAVVLLPGYPLSHPDHIWLSELVLSLELRSIVGVYSEKPYALGIDPPTVEDVARLGVEVLEEWKPIPTTAADREAKRLARRQYASQLPLVAPSDRHGWSVYERLLDREELKRGGDLVAWVRPRGSRRRNDAT